MRRPPRRRMLRRRRAGGWARLEHEMESRPVPGTWTTPSTGGCRAAWQWRPLLVPEEWLGGAWLWIGGFCGRLDVYIDEEWRATAHAGDAPVILDLTADLPSGASHELILRTACEGIDETEPCGVWGEVLLLPSNPGERTAKRSVRPPA